MKSAWIVTGWVAFCLVAAPISAQTTELDRVEELARMGRTEEARTALGEWWEGARDASSRRDLQRGLWLRGRLTVDPAEAELDYQRLVVLYPNGPYSAQALFRLAQAAYVQGDFGSAQGHVATLVRDYPTSATRAEAEAWMRAAGAPETRAEMRPMPAQSSVATAPGAQPPASQDSSSGLRPSQGRPPAPADAVLEWFVQFGAFSDEVRAFALQRELVDAGLAARLVRVEGSGFVHVRIGRFATRDEAGRELENVSRLGFTAAIVRDGRAEEVVRR